MTDLERLITHVQATTGAPVSTQGAQAFADEVYALGGQVLPATQLSQLRGTEPPTIESLIPDPSTESPFYGAPLLAAAVLTLDWRERPERRAAGRALAITSVHRATSGPLGAALILSDPGGQGLGSRCTEAPAPHERGWPLTLSSTGQRPGTSVTLLHVAGAWLWLSGAGVSVPSPRIIRDWMSRSTEQSAVVSDVHRWIIVNLWHQLSKIHSPETIQALLDRWSAAMRPPVTAEVAARLTLQYARGGREVHSLPPHLRDKEFLQLPKVAQTLLQNAGDPLAVTRASRRRDDQLTVSPPGRTGLEPRAAITDMGPALSRATEALKTTWEGLGITKAAQVRHVFVTAQKSAPSGGLTQMILSSASTVVSGRTSLMDHKDLRAAHSPNDLARALINLAADLEAWIAQGNWNPERVWPVFARGKASGTKTVSERLIRFGPPTPELLCLAALIGLRQEAYYGTYGVSVPLPLRLTLSRVATRALNAAAARINAAAQGRRLETYIQPTGDGWVTTHLMMLDMDRPFIHSVSEDELATLIGSVE